MNIAIIAHPFRIALRWLLAGFLAATLFTVAAVQSAPVGAAGWCGGQYTNYCPVGYAGYATYPRYAGYYGYAPYVAYRQYTDNRTNCPDGQVTQTPGGYFCTNYGGSAFVVNGNAPYGYAGYVASPRYVGYYPYLGYWP